MWGAIGSTAAAFLQKFVDKDVKWAHLDLAGALHSCCTHHSTAPRLPPLGVMLHVFQSLLCCLSPLGVILLLLCTAGPGMYSKARGEMCAGATGFGARVLVEYLESVSTAAV